MKFYLPRATIMSLIVALLFSGLFIAQAEDPISVDRILPEHTLLYLGADDCALMNKYAESMPFTKILQEKEVVDFLAKPKAYIKEAMEDLKGKLAEENEALAGQVTSLFDLSVARYFFALTHLSLPPMEEMSGQEPMPDLGFALGIALQNDVDPEDLLKNILNALAEGQGVELSYEAMDYNGHAYTKLSCPHAPELPLYCFHIDDLFIVTLSEKSFNDMVDCYSGKKAPCLAARKEYKGIAKQFKLPRSGSSQCFLDAEGLLSFIKEAVTMGLAMSGNAEHTSKVDAVVKKLGLDGYKAFFNRSLSKDGVARTETLFRCQGESRGLMKVFPADPIDKAEFKMVPKGASQFTIFRFDLAALYDLIMDVIQTIDEGVYAQVQGGLQGVSAMLAAEGEPIDLRRDLIGQFGTRCIMYSLGGGQAMGAMMPSFHVFLEVKEYNKFIETLQSILKGLGAMNPEISSAVSLSSIDYNGQPIHYLQISELPMVTPCFCEVGDYLAFGIQINDLKKLIKEEGQEKESILDSDDFKTTYANVPQEAPLYSISYSKTKETFSSSYNQISMYIPLMTMALPPEIELPLDLQMLPTSECIEKYLFSSITAEVGVDENSSKYVTYGPIGGEVIGYALAAAAGAGVAALYMVESTEAEQMDVTMSLDGKKAGADDPELLEKRVRMDLAALSNGCFVYKIEYNKYPQSLDELLKPTDDWPNGFIGGPELPKDPWGNSYLFENLESTGKNYKIWSTGPDGIDQGGEGDDIVKIK